MQQHTSPHFCIYRRIQSWNLHFVTDTKSGTQKWLPSNILFLSFWPIWGLHSLNMGKIPYSAKNSFCNIFLDFAWYFFHNYAIFLFKLLKKEDFLTGFFSSKIQNLFILNKFLCLSWNFYHVWYVKTSNMAKSEEEKQTEKDNSLF